MNARYRKKPSFFQRAFPSLFFFENKIFLLSIASGLPGSLAGMVILWTNNFTLKVELTLSLFILLGWIGFSIAVREKLVNTMRTVSNLLTALREADYSMRAVSTSTDDVLGDIALEINSLADTLQKQRMSAMAASSLLKKVMDEIEIAILSFGPDMKIRLMNRHAELLLGKPQDSLKGKTALDLGLDELLAGETPRIISLSLPGSGGRWELRRGIYHEQGLPHQIVVLSDLTSTLREEERQAWKRLVQVLRHEINNSLAPIHSLAESLQMLLNRSPRPGDWESDIRQGLQVIGDRSNSLNRFMKSYAQLTKLPKPSLVPLKVKNLILRSVNLQGIPNITITGGPDIEIHADAAQMDQLMINLLKNAVETNADGQIMVHWQVHKGPVSYVEICIEDEGQGIMNPENLFVPFFTTKPQGTGLGLMISRQIAEAHGGVLTLENRPDRPGCRAMIRLPLHRL